MSDSIPTKLTPKQFATGDLIVSERPETNQFYLSARWKAIRISKLSSEPLCRLCGNEATDVDHLDNDQSNNSTHNLVSFCHTHHSFKTNQFDKIPEHSLAAITSWDTFEDHPLMRCNLQLANIPYINHPIQILAKLVSITKNIDVLTYRHMCELTPCWLCNGLCKVKNDEIKCNGFSLTGCDYYKTGQFHRIHHLFCGVFQSYAAELEAMIVQRHKNFLILFCGAMSKQFDIPFVKLLQWSAVAIQFARYKANG